MTWQAIITRSINDEEHSTGEQNYPPVQVLKSSTLSRLSCKKTQQSQASKMGNLSLSMFAQIYFYFNFNYPASISTEHYGISSAV